MTALTKRETAVMRLVCEGLTGQGIGEALGISSRTVEVHKANAVRKLYARNQTHAAVLFDRTARAEAAEARNKVLEEALSWYQEQVSNCQRISDAARNELARDLGQRAAQALGATHD